MPEFKVRPKPGATKHAQNGHNPTPGAIVKPDDEPLTPQEFNTWQESLADEETFEKNVAESVYAKRVNREAIRRLDAEAFSLPEDDGSLDYQFDNPAPPPEFIIAGIIPKRGVIQINAQWKAGKTTLADVNLAASLASGKKFLDHYQVNFPAGNIGIWNLEVDAGTMQSWLFPRLPTNRAARRRIFPKHLRGKSVDLLNPQWAEWAVGWLHKHNIKVWIIDPLSKLLRSENDAADFNEWWRAMEEIAERAGVDLVVIVHHTGHGGPDGDALPRSRGSSAMQGNPDVVFTYRHGGKLGEVPPTGDTRRYFGGFGRGVDLPEITVDFDPRTKTLSLVPDSPGRSADQRERRALDCAGFVWTSESINKTALRARLGINNEAAAKVIEDTIHRGWIVEADGPNRSKLYSKGAVKPPFAPTFEFTPKTEEKVKER
jgi:hypothetical protein